MVSKEKMFGNKLPKFLLILLTTGFLFSGCSSVKKSVQTLKEEKTEFAPLPAETNACIEMLRDGLRDVYVTKDSTSFFSDSKKYFMSEEFTSDYRSGKWSGGISVVVDNVPLGLNAGASDDKLKAFQKTIQDASSVIVSSTTYSTISRSTLNIELANAFNACVEDSQKFGLSIDVTGNKTASVTIKYKPLSSNDPKPKITSVDLVGIDENERTQLLSRRLKPGTLLKDQLVFTATRKPEEELLIAINTSNGLSIVKRLEASELEVSAAANPVGTIIASYLNFEQFNKATKNNGNSGGIWASNKSKWAPCDGRPVPNSKFQALTSQNTIPDLRGMFLRGLNKFDPYQPVQDVRLDKADPDNRIVGSYQVDQLKSHTHTFTYLKPQPNSSDGGGGPHDVSDTDRNNSGTTAASGGPETRPKNVSIYYYIRIN